MKTIYINADVVTVDTQCERAQAFGVMDGRFAVVGTEAEVRAWGGEAATVVDLDGKTVVPGFIEGHNHLSYYSVRMDHADCSSPLNTRIDQVLERLKVFVNKGDEDEWIIGFGYDDTLIEDKRHLTRDELDQAGQGRPIAITHTSGHLAYINSRAMELMGIPEDVENPEGGEFYRDENGRLNGLISETALYTLYAVMPIPTCNELKGLIRRAVAQANKNGVTSIHDAAIGIEGSFGACVQAYRELADEGELNLRAYLTILADHYNEYLPLGMGTGFGTDYVRLGSVKLLQDGSIQGYTGWLSEPYHSRREEGHVSQPIMAQEALDELVEKYHSQGLQVAIHGNGDAAIESIILAVERAQEKFPRKDPRHLLIHCQTVREEQLPRMKKAGIMPSYFINHVYYWGDRHRDIFLGPDRAARMNPLATSLKHGVTFSLHTDLPITPIEPLRMIHAAVNRLTRNGNVLGEAERVSPLDAIRGVTLWAAATSFEEDIKGSITPGKLADWVVLSDNPLTVAPETVDALDILETVVGGKTVYKAE